MISVFSNYLDPFIEAGLLPDVEQTPHNIYEQLRIAYNQGAIGLMNTTRLFVPYYEGQDPDEFDYDLLSEINSNKQLKELVVWFNSKIIPELETLHYQTIGVRVRIFTSKLNKLVEQEYIDSITAIKLHTNLTKTLENEYNLRIDEDLPF